MKKWQITARRWLLVLWLCAVVAFAVAAWPRAWRSGGAAAGEAR